MGKSTFLTQTEEAFFKKALAEGDVDAVFEQMAAYLERNQMQISDHILRLYIDKELFSCLTGRSQDFDRLLGND